MIREESEKYLVEVEVSDNEHLFGEIMCGVVWHWYHINSSQTDRGREGKVGRKFRHCNVCNVVYGIPLSSIKMSTSSLEGIAVVEDVISCSRIIKVVRKDSVKRSSVR